MEDWEYLTIEEAAGALNRSTPTVWRLIKRYGVQTFRKPLDRRSYVRKADIDRLLASFEPKERAS